MTASPQLIPRETLHPHQVSAKEGKGYTESPESHGQA